MAERLPVRFRATTAEGAIEAAKQWARANGMTLRTVASCRIAEDVEAWVDDAVTLPPDFAVVRIPAWDVVLVVADAPVPLPEPPTLWGSVA